MFPFTSGVFLGLSTLLVFVGVFVLVVPWLRRGATGLPEDRDVVAIRAAGLGSSSQPRMRKRTAAILIPSLLVATTIASVWYIAFWRALH